MQQFMTAAEQKCRAVIGEYALFDGVSSVLIGFSGGADSTVLLHLLHRIGAEYGIAVTAAHIHHMIRGEEADHDLEHCRRICAQAEIPLLFERINVPLLAKERKMGLEECARLARYEAFHRLCAQHGFDCIATAHTADDTLETMLFHLIRGCGTEGLSGIAPRRGQLIRPLIRCTREEILSYLAQYHISYTEDSTNSDLNYARNRIRHTVIPQLRQINQAAAEHATAAGELLRRDATFLRSLSDTSPWSANLPDVLLSRKIRMAWADASSGGALGETHIKAAISLYREEGNEGKSLSLPGKVKIRISDGKPVFFHAGNSPEPFCIKVRPGINEFPGGCLIWAENETLEKDLQKDINARKIIYKLFIHLSVDSAKIRGEINLRSRLPGDAMRVGSMTKQVRRLMQEQAIPSSDRGTWPILCDSDGPLWVPLCAPADRIRGEGASLFFFKNDFTDGENDCVR